MVLMPSAAAAIWSERIAFSARPKPERIAPGHPEQNGSHEQFHAVLKAETTRPPAANAATARGKRSSRTITCCVGSPEANSARRTDAESIATLEVLDEIRRQIGVDFDEESVGALPMRHGAKFIGGDPVKPATNFAAGRL